MKKLSLVHLVAKKTKYSVSHVSNVLAGRRNNEQIMKVAREMKKEMNAKKSSKRR